MEPRWTKGPWRHVAIEGGWDGVAAADGIRICSLSYNNPANATLAAAAPELYDALHDAAAIFRHYEAAHLAKGTDEGRVKASANAAFADRFERQLARARGETT